MRHAGRQGSPSPRRGDTVSPQANGGQLPAFPGAVTLQWLHPGETDVATQGQPRRLAVSTCLGRAHPRTESWGSTPSSASCRCRPWCLKESPPTWEIRPEFLAPGSTSNQGPWGHLRSEPAGRSFCLSNQGREKNLNDVTQNSNKRCGTAPLGGPPQAQKHRMVLGSAPSPTGPRLQVREQAKSSGPGWFPSGSPRGRVLKSLGRMACEPYPRHTGKGPESAGPRAAGDINGSLIQPASRQRQPRRRG